MKNNSSIDFIIIKKLTYIICIFIIFISNTIAHASYLANGFFVNDRSINFDSTANTTKCCGKLFYPDLGHADEALAAGINDEIHNFIELYSICNLGEKSNFSVTYDIPESENVKAFSILWTTKKDDKLHRIDTINFNMNNNNLLGPQDIFVNNSSNYINQMVNLSEGHMNTGDSWDQFMDKVTNRDIQFYIRKKEWYIIFNPTSKLDKIVDVKIPEYFLQGRDVRSQE